MIYREFRNINNEGPNEPRDYENKNYVSNVNTRTDDKVVLKISVNISNSHSFYLSSHESYSLNLLNQQQSVGASISIYTHLYPSSISLHSEQPSFFPESQTSSPLSNPSPQIGIQTLGELSPPPVHSYPINADEQSSLQLRFPSSHISVSITLESPHTGLQSSPF